ncbi:MAG: hypothetical protein AB9921_03185 [Erysipelotrichaceae bacterium]
MNNDIVETAYIVSIDELSFLRKQKPYQNLKFFNLLDDDDNIIRDATAMLSLKSKGFLEYDDSGIIVNPVIELILNELCDQRKQQSNEIPCLVIGEKIDLMITKYRLQASSYRIVIEKKGDLI